MKRVSWFSSQSRNNNTGDKSRGIQKGKFSATTAKATVKFPEEFLLGSQVSGAAATTKKVDILIVSDSYIGMEWRVAGVEVPAFSVSNGEGNSSGSLKTVDVDARVEKK